jgi:hypothetical protein
MSTTALFVDLLIIGIQVATWLILLIFTLFDYRWARLEYIKDSETAIAIMLLPMFYPIGIFIDNLADYVLHSWRDNIRKKYDLVENQTITKLLTTLKDERLSDYFDYVRIRIRISRSSALNFTLITILSIVFTLSRLGFVLGESKWTVAAFELIVGVCFIALAVYSWFSITDTFYKKLKQSWEMMPQEVVAPSKEAAFRAK